jgi:hypothetical protein
MMDLTHDKDKRSPAESQLLRMMKIALVFVFLFVFYKLMKAGFKQQTQMWKDPNYRKVMIGSELIGGVAKLFGN